MVNLSKYKKNIEINTLYYNNEKIIFEIFETLKFLIMNFNKIFFIFDLLK